ncbi:MAG: dihydroorotate dehydrogenase electron transfer subunit [Bacillota bacterium]|jgi:dihydroorotate dehydrogenase electron transfer subunit
MQRKHLGCIALNEKLTTNTGLLRVAAPDLAADAWPGQFVQLRVTESYQPLLRTPLSIHDCDPAQGMVDLLYAIVGESTRLLSQLQPGAELDMLGPLGNGFDLNACPERTAWLVAGGIGIAPLLYLARQLAAQQRPLHLFFGARCAEALVRLEAFQQLGAALHLATDDGSCGQRGTVLDLLESAPQPSPPTEIFACGPQPMLRALQSFARERQIAAQLSLEAYMACGVGACLGCAVPRPEGGYLHVCSDGPVFRIGEVLI